MIKLAVLGFFVSIAAMKAPTADGQDRLALLILDSNRGSESLLLSQDADQVWGTQQVVPKGYSVVDITETGWLLLASDGDEEAGLSIKSAFSEDVSGPFPVPRAYEEVCLSPRADRIVYIGVDDKDGSATIYLLDFGSLVETQIMTADGDAASLSWSRDGRRLAFYMKDVFNARNTLGFRLCVADLDAENLEAVPITPPSLSTRVSLSTLLVGKPSAARWSPDNRKLLFEAAYDGAATRSYVVADDGTSLLPAHWGHWITNNSIQSILQKPIEGGFNHPFVFVNLSFIDGKDTLTYSEVPLPHEFGHFAFTGTSELFAIVKFGGGLSVFRKDNMEAVHSLPMRSSFAKWIERND